MANASGVSDSSSGHVIRAIVMGIFGAALGGSVGDDLWSALSGAAIGLLFAYLQATREQLAALDRAYAGLVEERDGAEVASQVLDQIDPVDTSLRGADESPGETPRHGANQSPYDTAPRSANESPYDTPRTGVAASTESPAASPPSTQAPIPPAAQQPIPSVSSGPSAIDRGIAALRSFFFGGNTVVRVGLLVLLVGLTLLAKYAADNALFPVEARLAFAALVGLALVGLGYRQRARRPGFGLSLQGGGLAALYLVTFFAFRTYELIPGGLAFGLFVALAIATAILSVVQRSEPLLVIGSLGGFLAPVLASTGGGNHVVLFSYYLMLIVSIVAVAWRQSWRAPPIVAFVCTYGVAGGWGVLRYESELFSTTEPFVLAFMALFTSVAVLHAWRRPPNLRGVVDGTLVFGTPFVSILLQGALVRDMELGLALSAAGFAVFYLGWTLVLWRVADHAVRPLAEAFLALAVGFATMAIPFAFDEALTTSVAWALEGVGLYWVGARQSRTLPRVAGFALQVLAGLAFFGSVVVDHVDSSAFLPIANGRALSCFALAAAGMGIARIAYVQRDRLRPFEVMLAQGFGISGLLWWTGGSIAEIDQFVVGRLELSALLAWITATAVALELGAVRWRWEPGRLMALASLPALAFTLVGALEHQEHLLAELGWLTWPAAFVGLYFIWQRMSPSHPRWLLPFRAGSLWLLALVTAFAAFGAVGELLSVTGDWEHAAFGVGLAGALLVSLSIHRQGRAPFEQEPRNALLAGLGPVAGVALLTIVWLQLAARGDVAPLPYLPILNPVDVTVWLLAIAIWSWWKGAAVHVQGWLTPVSRGPIIVLLAALAFGCLNGVLARTVHQWTGVAYHPDALWDSVAMQVTLSIAWTLVALFGTLLSSRRGWREAWMGFAALLGVVVFKLFTVDLSQLSTVARIGTFLAVGALLLVLGYLSPVPPARADETGGGPPDENDAEESAAELGASS